MYKRYLENYEEIERKVRYRLTINDLSSLTSSKLRIVRKTSQYAVVLCTFHKEKTASMFFYDNTTSFICYGCGTSGNYVSFFALMEGITYIEAVTRLARFYKIKMKWRKK